MSADICQHDELRQECQTCELSAALAELRAALAWLGSPGVMMAYRGNARIEVSRETHNDCWLDIIRHNDHEDEHFADFILRAHREAKANDHLFSQPPAAGEQT